MLLQFYILTCLHEPFHVCLLPVCSFALTPVHQLLIYIVKFSLRLTDVADVTWHFLFS